MHASLQGTARWGRQVCADDASRWERCEAIESPPASCDTIEQWYSPASEACGIESGMCCMDTWDLDSDGDAWESLGNCVDIICL